MFIQVLDDKRKGRLERIRDLVLYRHGGTGVRDAVKVLPVPSMPWTV
jgi:hypothetical protein